MNKSSHYYLASEVFSGTRFLMFRAKFARECEIKKCFVVASNLNEALNVIYSHLSPVWGSSYLDNYLLSLEFYDSLVY